MLITRSFFIYYYDSNKIPMSHSIVVVVSLIILFLLGAFFFYLYIIRIQNANNASFYLFIIMTSKKSDEELNCRAGVSYFIYFLFFSDDLKNSKCYINVRRFFSSSSSCTDGWVDMNQSWARGSRQTSKFRWRTFEAYKFLVYFYWIFEFGGAYQGRTKTGMERRNALLMEFMRMQRIF